MTALTPQEFKSECPTAVRRARIHACAGALSCYRLQTISGHALRPLADASKSPKTREYHGRGAGLNVAQPAYLAAQTARLAELRATAKADDAVEIVIGAENGAAIAARGG